MPIPSPADFRNKTKKHSEVREMLAQMAENVEEKPKELTANSNLNNYLDQGTYVLRRKSDSAQVLNLPPSSVLGDEVGFLIVAKLKGTVTTRQFFVSSGGFLSSRLFLEGVWTDWLSDGSFAGGVNVNLTATSALNSGGMYSIPAIVTANMIDIPSKCKGKDILYWAVASNTTNKRHNIIIDADGVIYTNLDSNTYKTIGDSNGVFVNTDLNTISRVGTYYCRSDSDATLTKNFPSLKAGTLKVHRYLTDDAVYQQYTDLDNNIFLRVSKNGGTSWGLWGRLGADATGSQLFNIDELNFADLSKSTPKQLHSRVQVVESSKAGFTLFGNPGQAKSLMFDYTDSQVVLTTDGTETLPLVVLNNPVLGSFGDTLIVAYKYADSSKTQQIYWQQQAGSPGRLQITQNAQFDGVGNSLKADSLQCFIGGATEGLGVGGNVKAGLAKRDQWNVLMIHLASGSKASKFWLNGELIDSFTCPAVLAVQPTLMGEVSASSPLKIGRIAKFVGKPTDLQVKALTEYVTRGYTAKSSETTTVLNAKYSFDALNALSHGGTVSEAVAAMLCTDDGSFMPENVLVNKNPTYRGRIASITKIMTFLVLMDQDYKLNDVLSRTAFDENSGSGLNIEIGDQFYLRDALFNLMLPSSNSTANVIARTYGHKMLVKEGVTGATDTQAYARWIQAMNTKARSIGMDSALFDSASGYGMDKSYPVDILKMMNEAIKHPLLMKVWRTMNYSFKIINTDRLVSISNTNSLLSNDSRVVGGKTGSGDGFHVAVLSQMSDGRYVASVAINSPSSNGRFDDIKLIVDQL